ncbi:PA1571 family protein [Pseudomonas palmensis]|uniref:PA1571 family protein n=1 Tax=Pseudomonas palmensis TaxID=2815362 RepID=UPI001AE28EC8|nr:PA1571 family protein [Pseudomonas palmensis]
MSLQNSNTQAQRPSYPNPACGSIIDAQGREIEITEDMIRKACEDLEKSRVELAKKA